jgi:hypothetical protein
MACENCGRLLKALRAIKHIAREAAEQSDKYVMRAALNDIAKWIDLEPDPALASARHVFEKLAECCECSLQYGEAADHDKEDCLAWQAMEWLREN